MSGAVIKLSKPVKAHGEEIHELTLAEPDSEVVMELGYPFLIHSGGAMELRPKVVGDYVVRLAKVPRSTVKDLTLKDLQACQAAVMGFFGSSEDADQTPS